MIRWKTMVVKVRCPEDFDVSDLARLMQKACNEIALRLLELRGGHKWSSCGLFKVEEVAE